MTELFIDIETYSAADLRRTGLYRYAEDPTFEILMAAWAIDDGPVTLAEGEAAIAAIPGLGDPLVVKIAHNAAFERICLRWLHDTDPSEWIDTMAMAAAAGRPQSLSECAKSLGVEAKGSVGARLIAKFCKPHRTKARVFGADEPEDWVEFGEYCVQDVVVLRQVYKALPEMPPIERQIWLTDQAINDRGLPIDTRMAEQAHEAAGVNHSRLMVEAKELTGLSNPNSVEQLRGWLTRSGCTLLDMKAETVAAKLAGDDLEPHVRRALEIRRETALSASKKYASALESVCDDGRLHGNFKYHGAHTGRWSGSGVQPQNLPRATVKLGQAAQAEVDSFDPNLGKAAKEKLVTSLVEGATLDAIDRLARGSEADAHTLKALVRALFVGPFTVVDYAAIEARVIAWLAGEGWALEAFEAGRDIYVETANRMSTPEKPLDRSQGKVACLPGGSMVLTDRGEIKLRHVTRKHRVWDGNNWVSHAGIVYQGMREVITYGGLTATPDHKVWVYGAKSPIRFDLAASSGARLTQSGRGGRGLRVGDGSLSRSSLYYKPKQLVPVFDLVNAGPNRRFTVNGKLVSNCLALGYAGSTGSLRVMGAEGTDQHLTELVQQWRHANQNIVRFWANLERAFRTGGTVGEFITIERDGNTRRIRLPSGRAISYHDVKTRKDDYGRSRLTFASAKGRGIRDDTYGGRLAENVTQAVARDVLAAALVRLHGKGIPVVGHVHDEVIVEGGADDSVQTISQLMCENPHWAVGLPLAAEGFTCDRYRKG